MLLCDHAQVAEGKLHLLGGGWTQIAAQASAHTVAMLVDVPWDRTNEQIRMVLSLHDDDGRPVLHPGEDQVPVSMTIAFEVGRPAGVRPGSPISMPLVVPVHGLALAPGRRYTWRLEVEGTPAHPDWSLAFSTA